AAAFCCCIFFLLSSISAFMALLDGISTKERYVVVSGHPLETSIFMFFPTFQVAVTDPKPYCPFFSDGWPYFDATRSMTSLTRPVFIVLGKVYWAYANSSVFMT